MEISSAPLLKKLGLKPGMHVILKNCPEHFIGLLGLEPENNVLIPAHSKQMADYIHVFYTRLKLLEKDILKYKKRLVPNGHMWISWPKRGSKIPSDLSRDLIRELGLAIGLVDVKVCAIDDDWSALKFVYRLKDR